MVKKNPVKVKKNASQTKRKVVKTVVKKKAHRIKRGDVFSLSTRSAALVPALSHQGSAFPVKGMAEFEYVTGSTNRVIFAFTNTGVSGTIGYGYSWPKAGGTGVGTAVNNFTLPLLNTSGVAGGPTSMRAMRFGVDIICNTQLLSRGGALYTLNSDQRFVLGASPSTMTANQWNDFFNTIITHPKRHKLDYNDFTTPKHMYSHVVDEPRYNDFDENEGVLSVDTFFQHIALWSGSSPLDRPMSTVVIAIETTSAAQLLTLTSFGQFYTRWPLNSIPGQAQETIPTTTHKEHLDSHTTAYNHAQQAPLDAEGIHMDRVFNGLGFGKLVDNARKAMPMLEYGANFLGNRMRNFGGQRAIGGPLALTYF